MSEARTSPRILVVDDHTIVRQGLRQICEVLGGFSIVDEASGGAEAVAMAQQLQPDVTLMDIAMPGMDGVEAIKKIMRQTPGARVIALTVYREEPYMLEAIRAGARGYLLKTVDAKELIAAIHAVHRGEYLIDPVIAARVLSEFHLPAPKTMRVDPLTESELQVLRLVASGMNNSAIAESLALSRHTVANRLRVIYEKLSVTNRTQAALYARSQGWVSQQD